MRKMAKDDIVWMKLFIVFLIKGIFAGSPSTMSTSTLMNNITTLDKKSSPIYPSQEEIEYSGCFYGECNCLRSMKMIQCDSTYFKRLRDLDFPSDTEILMLSGTAIELIGPEDMRAFPQLRKMDVREAASLSRIESGAFDGLKHLRAVTFDTTPKLEIVENGAFKFLPSFDTLKMINGGLTKCPNFTSLKSEAIAPLNLTLDENEITVVKAYTFKGMRLHHLSLASNKIEAIRNFAFASAHIVVLKLSNNPIRRLEDESFTNIEQLFEISLSDTDISHLPTNGLAHITSLNIFNTKRLTYFPSIFKFRNIQYARLHYFSHCCAFTYNTTENFQMAQKSNIGGNITIDCTTPATDLATALPPDDSDIFHDPKVWISDVFGNFRPINTEDDPNLHIPFDPDENFGSDLEDGIDVDIGFGAWIEGTIDPAQRYIHKGGACTELHPKDYSKVICTPKPDAFNPCSDVMEFVILRILIWFVAITALVGNGLVVIVLVSQKHKMTVPKFLMSNLAFADFCMGWYLLMVASVDVYTMGKYLNYTMGWQFGAGCKIAGYISMFSSELSVYTLTVITIERWYTIIYAIDLNKRIRLRLAARIMVGGWIFAILVAAMPLFEIGGYGITSMCLPFYVSETAEPTAIVYVVSILALNSMAFCITCACYVKMYLTVHNPNMVMKRKDSKVAKRMAILVFTDFACWAPIALFGLAGAFGSHLLTVDHSKFLIVLFYPINSCANPFLYAIFTKSFRRDLFLLLAKRGMCEERAMKYRGQITSGPRSMSQGNSSLATNARNAINHRDSNGSVFTALTGDSRASVVSMTTSKGSPAHTLLSKQSNIPLSPLVTNHNGSGEKLHKSFVNCSPKRDTMRGHNTVENATDALETVPEESNEGIRASDQKVLKGIHSQETQDLLQKTTTCGDRTAKEKRPWKRVDSGIHSMPSPSDCDEDEEDDDFLTTSETYAINESNYETSF